MQQLVEVVPYDPAWPETFQAERRRIQSALGRSVRSVHHIGSTAVVGLAARPTIDLLITLRPKSNFAEKLETLGYQKAEPLENSPTWERDGFRLLVFEQPNPAELERYQAMVDYLTENARRREEYAQLKGLLAQSCPEDPTLYQQGKAYFLAQLEQEARNNRPHPEQSQPSGRSVPMAVGICAGLILGLTVLHNIGTGLCFGLCFAVLLEKWRKR